MPVVNLQPNLFLLHVSILPLILFHFFTHFTLASFLDLVLPHFISLEDPCVPSPCGPHSNCREVNSHAVCSCATNFFGSPPNCKPECMVSSDCNADKACSNQRCVDPCPGTCGLNSRCQVVNHNAICSCQSGFVGDPFVRCISQPSKHYLKLPFHFYLSLSSIV